ncbi:hypothetical protein, partial [uncultured Dubosiella sp.]
GESADSIETPVSDFTSGTSNGADSGYESGYSDEYVDPSLYYDPYQKPDSYNPSAEDQTGFEEDASEPTIQDPAYSEEAEE